MNPELLDTKETTTLNAKPREQMEGVNGILAMGIVSIVIPFFITGLLGFGTLILGILAIMKGRQSINLYKDYPNDYTTASLAKAKAGFICGIIGVSFWAIIQFLVLLVFSL